MSSARGHWCSGVLRPSVNSVKAVKTIRNGSGSVDVQIWPCFVQEFEFRGLSASKLRSPAKLPANQNVAAKPAYSGWMIGASDSTALI
jgi:hypothetical protein